MRPYYPFKSKLFNATTYSFECPNINDTLSVKACLCKRRQFSSNGVASMQKIQTVQRSSSPWWVVSVIHTLIFTHFFDSESGNNSNFEGSKQKEIHALRLRDHFVLVRILILLVGWNHNYSELCLKMFNCGMPTLVQWTIHDVGLLHAYVSWLWRGSSLVKIHWRWNLAQSGHRVTFLMGCVQWYDYNHPIISVVLWPFHGAYHQIQVEKISPQQAQSQLQLLNAIALMIILKVRSKALQVNDTLW